MATPSSSSSAEERPSSSLSTAQLLEKRSVEIIESVNDLTFRYVFAQYASRDFVGARELIAGTVSGFTFSTMVGHIEGFGRAFPRYHIDTMPATVEVDERNGLAAVWVTCIVTNGADGLDKETVSIFHWRKSVTGKWECYKHTLLNGMPHIPH